MGQTLIPIQKGVILSSSSATLGEDGEAEYEFNIANSGTYDVAVRILFPFWDKNSINISLDGVSKKFY